MWINVPRKHKNYLFCSYGLRTKRAWVIWVMYINLFSQQTTLRLFSKEVSIVNTPLPSPQCLDAFIQRPFCYFGLRAEINDSECFISGVWTQTASERQLSVHFYHMIINVLVLFCFGLYFFISDCVHAARHRYISCCIIAFNFLIGWTNLISRFGRSDSVKIPFWGAKLLFLVTSLCEQEIGSRQSTNFKVMWEGRRCTNLMTGVTLGDTILK